MKWRPEDKKSPGSLYFEVDPTAVLSLTEPTEKQAMFAAVLAVPETFRKVNFPTECLKNTLCFMQSCLGNGTLSESYMPVIEELKRQLGEESDTMSLWIPPILVPTFTSALVYRFLSQETLDASSQSINIGSWYINFFLDSGGSPLYQMMANLLGLNPSVFTWGHLNEFQSTISSDEMLRQKSCAFSDFVFSQKNKQAIFLKQEKDSRYKFGFEKKKGTSIVAFAINSAIINGRLEWVLTNLYHFSLLYQFVAPELVGGDHFITFLGFLEADRIYGLVDQIMKLKNRELIDQVNYSLDVIKKHSAVLGRQQIAKLGFHPSWERYFTIFEKYASPTLESIRLFSRGSLKDIKELSRKSLYEKVSHSADGKNFVNQFFSEVKGKSLNIDAQIQYLQKIINDNKL